MSDDPLAARLINAAWGNPLLDIYGLPAYNSPATRPPSSPSGFLPGSASSYTGHAFRCYAAGVAASGPLSLFAVVRINSLNEKGIVVGLGSSSLGDTGVSIGLGASAPDFTGNNLVGVRGGVNYTQSGGPGVGTGFRSIGYTTDGVSAERWYADGRLVSSGGTGGTWGLSGSPALVALNHGSSSLGPSGGIATGFVAAWRRVLSAADFARLHVDPFVIVAG